MRVQKHATPLVNGGIRWLTGICVEHCSKIARTPMAHSPPPPHTHPDHHRKPPPNRVEYDCGHGVS